MIINRHGHLDGGSAPLGAHGADSGGTKRTGLPMTRARHVVRSVGRLRSRSIFQKQSATTHVGRIVGKVDGGHDPLLVVDPWVGSE